MKQNLRLRLRLFILILPLVTAIVLLSGAYASLESKAALTRIANRHLVFKAEQLRDYFYSEWDVISSLGFEDQPEYRQASENSFNSYAFSLLRSSSEVIFVFDSDKNEIMNISLAHFPDEENIADGTEVRRLGEALAPGWFDDSIFGEKRVGVVFTLDPLGWTVMVSDLSSTFFSDINNMRNSTIIILGISSAVLMVLLYLYISQSIKPVERLTATIQEIRRTGDLSRTADIESGDEIAFLAQNFNSMLGTINEHYQKLEESNRAESEARRIAVEREEETLQLLGRISDIHDEETGGHLRRIGILSAELSRLLGMESKFQSLMLNSAPLHDVGKIGIPDSIILKTGRLSSGEYEDMKRHTIHGYEILKDSKSIFLQEGAVIAYSHHEKWDGSGYPQGIEGREIPLSGRIVAIVDVFDALTSERHYKPAWPVEDALAYIVQQRGKHFDPDIVDVFAENFAIFMSYVART